MKIGVLKEGMGLCEEDIVKVVRSACVHFESLGATVEEVSIPEHVDGKGRLFIICSLFYLYISNLI